MRLNLQFYLGIGPALTRESWQRVKATVKRRDREICQYCGQHAPDGEPDHVLPLSRGGTDRLTNLVWTCKECNQSKGNKTLREWLSTLHETPVNFPKMVDVTPEFERDRKIVL